MSNCKDLGKSFAFGHGFLRLAGRGSLGGQPERQAGGREMVILLSSAEAAQGTKRRAGAHNNEVARATPQSKC